MVGRVARAPRRRKKEKKKNGWPFGALSLSHPSHPIPHPLTIACRWGHGRPVEGGGPDMGVVRGGGGRHRVFNVKRKENSEHRRAVLIGKAPMSGMKVNWPRQLTPGLNSR
jgi:hypothetical protein